MLDLEPLYRLVSLLPFECLQAGFMQQALVALILLAPMAATMGVQDQGDECLLHEPGLQALEGEQGHEAVEIGRASCRERV